MHGAFPVTVVVSAAGEGTVRFVGTSVLAVSAFTAAVGHAGTAVGAVAHAGETVGGAVPGIRVVTPLSCQHALGQLPQVPVDDGLVGVLEAVLLFLRDDAFALGLEVFDLGTAQDGMPQVFLTAEHHADRGFAPEAGVFDFLVVAVFRMELFHISGGV